ncbi:hypothetical protein MKK58_07975 [Methylobacterium sp. J-078]|uniref:hypothetical protein n=1 Tax=Methylobacterium sp. J-078 TaxID=2836657 RepID=UPI001FB9D4C5|nr:hypothetical protein [Methylobacterium sp. J-078]MCJ2044469.1 hypothetical protein [Methylobacterium sp. J-078]
MFDELLKFLGKLDGQQVSVNLECQADADGYLDKECPNDPCRFGFKVHEQDWSDIVRDEEVFCPSCGHAAPAQDWLTTEQVEWAKQAAFNQLTDGFDQAMRQDANDWNRRQRPNQLVSITMQVAGTPEPVQLPLTATEPMRLKISCEKCNCRYSVIGSAYFCPSCGHNAADHMFSQSLDKIRASLDVVPTLKVAIPDRDAAEHAARSLIEGGLQSAVTAFQRFAEALFTANPAAPKARRNAFQNLEEGSRLWHQAYGTTYEQHLGADDLTELGRYFQQRHLLAHKDGLVDADYVVKSGDASYREGQRLVIQAAAVRCCVDLVEKLGNMLRADAQTAAAQAKTAPEGGPGVSGG